MWTGPYDNDCARRRSQWIPRLTTYPSFRRYFDGCEAGDVESIRETLDPGVVHYCLADDRPPIRGAEHLSRFWSKTKVGVNAHWAVDHAISTGDEVVLERTVYWTHPDRGLRLANRGTDWYVLRDGKIREVRAYFNFPAATHLIERDSELMGFPYGERAYLVEVV